MEETTKKWEFRSLCSADLFPMTTLINKIGFKEFKGCFASDEVKKIASSKDATSVVSAAGMTIAFDVGGIILGNLAGCENDIYKILSNVSNLSEAEIRELPIAEFGEMITDFVQKPEFGDFFKVVSKWFK